MVARVNGHWLTVGKPTLMHRARTRGVYTLAIIRCSRATCIFRMLCMSLTIMLPFTACADVKMMSEMKTKDVMKKMKDTTSDASECVPIAPAALMCQRACASTPPRASPARTKNQRASLTRAICRHSWAPLSERSTFDNAAHEVNLLMMHADTPASKTVPNPHAPRDPTLAPRGTRFVNGSLEGPARR